MDTLGTTRKVLPNERGWNPRPVLMVTTHSPLKHSGTFLTSMRNVPGVGGGTWERDVEPE